LQCDHVKTCIYSAGFVNLPNHFVYSEVQMLGGWRFGAERPAQHDKVEDALQIDIRHWTRQNLLCVNGFFREEWHQDGGVAAFLDVCVDRADRVTLLYQWELNGVAQHECIPVRVTKTPCHFGGERSWFVCPACDARTATLYFAENGWGCRTCSNLAYTSQSENCLDRLRRNKAKLEEKLNDMRKSKGMHRATYQQLKAQWIDAEIAWQEVFAAQAAQRIALL
jgi:Zn-finger protein